MTQRTYTLTVVRADGTSHTTTATGHYAETMLDAAFKDAARGDTLYAVLLSGEDNPRAEWCRREEPIPAPAHTPKQGA